MTNRYTVDCDVNTTIDGTRSIIKLGVMDHKENKHLSINDVVDLLNKYPSNVRLCYHCRHCFINDWYGACCTNNDSEHYTRNWGLPVTEIKECEYFIER